MKPRSKQEQADHILEEVKEVLLCILWDSDASEYSSGRQLMPWLEEDAIYEIRKLALPEHTEKKYLGKINRLFGEYSEYIPLLRRREY
ncbi:MAG: hypothetical protein R6T99_05145 [Bacteroidales bacterium]